MRNLISKLKSTGRKVAVGVSLLGALTAAGCANNDCESNNFHDLQKPNGRIARVLTCPADSRDSIPYVNPLPYVNQIPVATVGMGFGNGLTGKVIYLVTGTDSDGTVADVYARKNNTPTNSTPWEIYSNGTSFQKDIIPGTNSLEAYAVDDKGAQSPIVTRSFVSPTEGEAEAIMDNVLNSKGYTVGITSLKNVQVTTGSSVPIQCQGTFEVDYSIDSNAIVEYISSTDDTTQKLSDKQKLDCANVSNKYFKGLPLSEIESRLNAWIDNGFQ